MKKPYKITGIFCDNCNANLTFCNHIGNDFKSGRHKGKEFDFCDPECRDEYSKKHRIKF